MCLLLRNGGEFAVHPHFSISIIDGVGTLCTEVASHPQIGARGGQLLDSLKLLIDPTQ